VCALCSELDAGHACLVVGCWYRGGSGHACVMWCMDVICHVMCDGVCCVHVMFGFSGCCVVNGILRCMSCMPWGWLGEVVGGYVAFVLACVLRCVLHGCIV